MLLTAEELEERREDMIKSHLAAAEALKNLNTGEFTLFVTESNRILGILKGSKDGKFLVMPVAAEYMDYKLRNCEAKNKKKRTYPIPFHCVLETKPVTREQVPLYLNFKYISQQFKNKFLR
jgi:hypothetical protein